MTVVFVFAGYEISQFLLLYNLIADKHKSPVFLVSDKFFAWERFCSNLPTGYKPAVPQMGATKMCSLLPFKLIAHGLCII